MKVAVAHTNDPDTSFACQDLVEQCASQVADWQPVAGILFAAIDFEHQALLDAIFDRYPDLKLIGCTTDGELSSAMGFQQDSVSLTLFGGDNFDVAIGLGRGASVDSEAAGIAAAQQALEQARGDVRLCITFPEALAANGISVLRGIQRTLGDEVPVFGGLSADQWRFVKTFQFAGREVFTDTVPVMLFTGDVQVSHGVASGWRPVGRKGVVTQSKGSELFKVDDQSALDFYRGYLGEKTPSSQYPLAIYVDSGNYYLRAPSGKFDESSGMVEFFADVPEGALVQMTEATRDGIVDATRMSMNAALHNYPGKAPDVALFVSCASRRQILGTKTGTEIESAMSCVAGELPHAGFYANGEIGPYTRKGASHFHNETFVTLLMGSG